MATRRHVFISHHHADDAKVSKFTQMLGRKSFEIRNSSIRAKPANKERLKKGLVSDGVIQRLLRMKISWAKTVVVLVGKKTHERRWVDWEIKEAHKQNKRIVGVFERGGTEHDVPPALEKYRDAQVNWNSDSIIDAIEGRSDPMEGSDGNESSGGSSMPRSGC